MILLQDKKDCCGCQSCVQICAHSSIVMREDEEGFLYPCTDTDTCTSCGLCDKICPVSNQNKKRKPLHVYAAKNQDENTRMSSSSGGIFTLLAEKIIREGGVVFGARFNENWEVVHDYAETIAGLSVFRGSKYVQSSIGNTFIQTKQFLELNRKVLYSGTPCQIAGLKLFLRKDYENLLTVDIVCHGVPSPKVWKYYLQELRTKNREQEQFVTFRDKSTGWGSYSFKIIYATKEFKELSSKNIFMKGFLKDLYLRPSCSACPSKSFKSGSDITLGDYWGIQNVLPDFDDNKGVGLVLLNTKKGLDSYNQTEKESIETTYSDAVTGNSCIEKSATPNLNRTIFFEKVNIYNTGKLIRQFSKEKFELRRNIRRGLSKIKKRLLR